LSPWHRAEIVGLAQSAEVVLATGSEWARNSRKGELGTAQIVTKPYDLERLMAAIRAALEQTKRSHGYCLKAAEGSRLREAKQKKGAVLATHHPHRLLRSASRISYGPGREASGCDLWVSTRSSYATSYGRFPKEHDGSKGTGSRTGEICAMTSARSPIETVVTPGCSPSRLRGSGRRRVCST